MFYVVYGSSNYSYYQKVDHTPGSRDYCKTQYGPYQLCQQVETENKM